jgi:hypothetical protein
LKLLRRRLTERADADRLALIVAAAGWAAWGQGTAPPADAFRDDLAGLRHLELSHGYYFDRFDEAGYLAALARAVRHWNVPEDLIAAVRNAWAGEVRAAEVEVAAAAVADDPVQNLRRLDNLANDAGPGFARLAARVFEHHAAGPTDRPPFPPEQVRALARGWSTTRGAWHYAQLRADLLGLLIAESLDPLELAAACAADVGYGSRALAAHVRDDLNLRVVWLAARIDRG